MNYTGILKRAELYDDHTAPYTNVQAVYNANKGRFPNLYLIVTDAHWDAPGHKPCGNYKVAGKVLSREWNSALGFGWSGNDKPVMGWSDMSGVDNFLCTIPAIAGGIQQDVNNQTSGVKRPCLRTWWGFDGDRNCTIEVTTTNYTLDAIIDRMEALGIVDGMVLDGSGSSQCYDGKTRQTGDGRTICNYLLLWFEGSTKDKAKKDNKVNDAGLKFAYNLTKRTKTDMIILHHVGEGGNWTVDQIHKAHLSKGWAGIAYHYYVRRDGTIWRGRPEYTIGGHTLNYNSTSIGICAEGNFEHEIMTDAQKSALKALLADVRSRYPVKVVGHRELNATVCPGANYPFAEITGIYPQRPSPTNPEDMVKTFQTWLNSRYGSGLVLDGIYGKKTKTAAVKAYQQHLGVKADGVFGPITKAAVRTMGMGSTGTGVYILQGLLYCNGFNANGFDGVFGVGTKSAVMQYQARKGLLADGLAGRNTIEKLMK